MTCHTTIQQKPIAPRHWRNSRATMDMIASPGAGRSKPQMSRESSSPSMSGLSPCNPMSNGQDSAGDLANRVASYRSNSEFGPVHHIICDEAAALIRKLVSENRQLVADHDERRDLIARQKETATEVRSSAKAMLAAFGGNVPDWLRDEAARLDRAVAQAEER